MNYRPLKLFPILTVLPTLVICSSHVRATTEPTLSVIALPIILLATVPFRMLLYRYDIHIANQIFWIPHAILYATLVHFARTTETYKAYFSLDWTYSLPPKWLIAFYFPASCFHMAFKMDLHILKRSYFQIFFLTVIGGLLNTIMLGSLLRYTLNTNWTLSMGMCFGSMCIITEAAHRAHVANEMDKYKHLITVMEGESLIGTAIGMLLMDLTMGITENHIVTWFHVIFFLIWFILVAIVIGLVMGCFSKIMIHRLHNDRMGLLSFSFVCTYLTYYLTTIMNASGPLASVIVCLKIAAERARYGNEIDQILQTFWETIVSIGKPYFFVAILGICFERVYYIGVHDYSKFSNVFVLYFMSSVTRMIGFLIVSPVLSRTGYGIDFKSIVFIMWAPQKSIVSLLCALTIFHDIKMQRMAVESMGGITAIFLFTLILNSNTVPLLLNFLSFSEISIMKKTNMNNCMKYIIEKRRHVISLLKMNRFLSDANWPLVLDITRLKHPYKLNSANENVEQGDDDFFGDSRSSYCTECDQVVQLEPTPKEYAEMTREAKLRVLKSEKISYIRQYEKGLLSQEGIRSLLQAVEVALDSPDLIIKLDDYFRVIKKRNFYDILKKCVMWLTRKVARTKLKPNIKFRRRCYVIANHIYFTLASYIVIVLHVLLEVLYFALKATWKPHEHIVIETVNWFIVLFEVFYMTRVFVKIMALSYLHISQGIKLYLTEFMNILDIVSVLAKTCCIIAMLTIYVDHGWSSQWDTIHNYYYYFVIFKSLQCLTVILNLVPKIIRTCDKNYDIRIAYAYEIGHCLVIGYSEVGEMLVQMIRNKRIRDIIHKQLDADRLAITRELGLMHKFSPWIAVSTKTRQAIKATLNHLHKTVEELRTSGFLDEYEYSKLQDSIEDRMRVLRNLKTVELSSPKSLFKELQWLQNEQIADYLYKNSSTKVWDAGNVICEKGQISDGVFVLVTGLFKLVYEPDPDFIKYQQETGCLPIVDYLASTKFCETMQDYIFAGNSIGELCTLTQRPYNCTIVAEVPSQAFVLSQRLLLHSISHDTDPINGLAARLWKYVAINISVSLLQETIAYQSHTQDQIRLLLENSFLPNLIAYKVLVVHEKVHDLILIDGIVQDLANADRYIAPCYIPRTVKKLVLHRNSADHTKCAVLLILPQKDTSEYDLMDKLEDQSELDTDASDSTMINPLRLRGKKTLPLFKRRRSSLIRKMQRLGAMPNSPGSEENPIQNAQSALLSENGSKEYLLKPPLSLQDISYKNKQISTFAIARNDDGYSKAKIVSANAVDMDAEIFMMDPSLRKSKISSLRINESNVQMRSKSHFDDLRKEYTNNKLRERHNTRFKNEESNSD